MVDAEKTRISIQEKAKAEFIEFVVLMIKKYKKK